MSLADRTPPSAAEFHGYRERFNNWGRWGAEDQLGTLNHVSCRGPGAPSPAPTTGRPARGR
jgi:hypothetical protein